MKTASINLSAIPANKIINHKNGKKYLNITIWDNDEPDQYGNHFSIQVSTTKEERDNGVKAIYLGNGKDWSKDKKQETKTESTYIEDDGKVSDDLPF